MDSNPNLGMRSRLHSYAKTIFAIDLRSLGAFRIVLGLFLLIDLALRARFFCFFLTDAGPFPRDAIPYVPSFRFLFFLSGDAPVQMFLYAVMVLAAIMFTVGYKTRVATVILWFCIAAHHARCPMALSGEDRLPLQFLIWSIFLPMGAKYSVDSWRRPIGANSSPNPYLSLASAAILLQFIAMYLITGLTKSGDAWVDGSAIWRSLGSDYWVMPLGRLFRESYGLTVVMTYVVPAFEWLLALTLLIPFHRNRIRAVTIVLLFLFQVGLLFSIELRMFPLMSNVGLILFVPPAWWEKFHSSAVRRDLEYETRATAADSGRRWRSAAIVRDAVVASLMIFSGVLALQCLSKYRSLPLVPRSSAPAILAGQIGLNQSWPMYSPNPDSHEYKVKLVGIQEGTAGIDILAETVSPSWEKVKRFHEAYRFQYYLERMFHKRKEYPRLMEAYLDWICREWHEAVDSGMNIDRVRYFLEIRDMRPVERQPRRLMLVAEHACRWTGEEDSR